MYGFRASLRSTLDNSGLSASTAMAPMTQLVANIVRGNRASLARAITLLESRSNQASRQEEKLELIRDVHRTHHELKPDTVRVAITGSPGVGKSTFIEAFGMHLIEKFNKKVAVLAVDPSSAIRGGSILADKTRMITMTKHPNAFIRPSPSRLHLGGVNQATGGSILLCEAAGYDVILVETVGVGQSEYEVAHLCDMFTLLVAPSAGDELQAIKKGIVEMANLILITKNDGDLMKAARRMKGEIRSATKFQEADARPEIICASAVTKEGIEEAWTAIESRVNSDKEAKQERRQKQKIELLKSSLVNELFELLCRRIQYENYEARLKQDPTLSLYELVNEIIYKDLYSVLKQSEQNPQRVQQNS